jgi:dienelactone hydrolase
MFRCLAAALFAGLFFAAASVRADPPPVEAYGKLPAVDLMSLSPSGKRFAFVGVDGETRSLAVANIDNSPVIAAPTDGAKMTGIDWAGDDHVLFTSSATITLGPQYTEANDELSSVTVIDLKTHHNFIVFSKLSNVIHAVFGVYGVAQIDGHWYGYFGGLTMARAGDGFVLRNTFTDLYKVDLDTGAAQIVANGSVNTDGWLVGPAGEIIARSSYSETSGGWQVWTGAAAGKVLASGHSDFGGVSLSRGRTPDTILIARPEADGSVTYEEVPLTGAPAVDVPDSGAIGSRFFDPASGLWLGFASKGDRPEPKMFDPGVAAKFRGARKAFPDQTVEFKSWSANLNSMIVFTSGGDDSGTYWLVDIATGKADPLGSTYPTVTSDDVGPIRMVGWKAADGLDLHGVLSLPPGRSPKNLPLVVLPHGGPEARDYPVFDWWAQAFASRGYAVFQPNFRGSSDYGVAFRNAGFGQWGRKMQSDISDGVAELARQGIVDPKRACIVGASYGGYAALAGVTVQNGLYRCAVSVAGVSHPSEMIEDAEGGGGANATERYWRAFMGAGNRAETGLISISPVKLADHADAPILLIHGQDDSVVPLEQSREMERALRQAGKPVELVVLPTADHWFLHEDMRVAMVTRSVAFVEKYDPPDPAPVQIRAAITSPTP